MKILIKNKQLYLIPESHAEFCQIELLSRDLNSEQIEHNDLKNWDEVLEIRIPLKLNMAGLIEKNVRDVVQANIKGLIRG